MFYLIQLLNGVQYGLLLFLLASGLTLIFGIMGVINLAHGSFYMVGAYLAYWLAGITGSFWLALPLGVGTALVIGVLLEVTLFSRLYKRDPDSDLRGAQKHPLRRRCARRGGARRAQLLGAPH